MVQLLYLTGDKDMANTLYLQKDIDDLYREQEEKLQSTTLTELEIKKVNFQRTRANPLVIPYHLFIPGIDKVTSTALCLCAANGDTKGLAIHPMVAATTEKIKYDAKNYKATEILDQMAEVFEGDVAKSNGALHIGREYQINPLKLAAAIKLIHKFLDKSFDQIQQVAPWLIITLEEEIEQWKEAAQYRFGQILIMWMRYSPQSLHKVVEGETEVCKAIAAMYGINPDHIDWDSEWDVETAAEDIARAIHQSNPGTEHYGGNESQNLGFIPPGNLCAEPSSSDGSLTCSTSVTPSVFLDLAPVPNDAVSEFVNRLPDPSVNAFVDAVRFGGDVDVYPHICSVTKGDGSILFARTRDIAQVALASNPGMNLLQEADILDALHQCLSESSGQSELDTLRMLGSRQFFPSGYHPSGRSPRLTAISGVGKTFFSCTSKVRKLVASKLPNVVEVDLTSCYTSLMLARFDMPELRALLDAESFWVALFEQLVSNVTNGKLRDTLRGYNFSNMKKLLKPMWYATTFMGGRPAYLEAWQSCVDAGYITHSRKEQTKVNDAFLNIPAVREMRATFKEYGEKLMRDAEANNGWIDFDNCDRLRVNPKRKKSMATALSYFFQAYEEAIMSYLTVKCWDTARVILSQADGAWLYLLSPTGLGDARQAVAEACDYLLQNENALGLDVVVAGRYVHNASF